MDRDEGIGWLPGPSEAAWTACAAEGCRSARVRHRGRVVGVPVGLSDPIGLLGELRSRDIDLYLHQQALDTGTPSGRMLLAMLGVYSEFERAMIRDRVMAGLDRARAAGKRLDRPRTTPFKNDRIRAALDEGRGVREAARLLKISAAKVSEVRRLARIATPPSPERSDRRLATAGPRHRRPPASYRMSWCPLNARFTSCLRGSPELLQRIPGPKGSPSSKVLALGKIRNAMTNNGQGA